MGIMVQKTDWVFWLTTVFTVWSVQQIWKFSARYVLLVRYGVAANRYLIFRAWGERKQATRCSFFIWWGLSLLTVCYVYQVYDRSFAQALMNNGVQWLCLLMLPLFFIALARIDQQVFLLPDALLIPLAFLGGLYTLSLGKLPMLTVWGLFLIVLLGFYCFNIGIEKQRLNLIIQWLGAGDLKFLLVAFFWLSAYEIVLMWGYAALLCWVHQGWLQRSVLPRGHAALGPYLVIAWVFTQWVHPTL